MPPLRAVALFLALARLGFLARAVRAGTNLSEVPSEGCSLTCACSWRALQFKETQVSVQLRGRRSAVR